MAENTDKATDFSVALVGHQKGRANDEATKRLAEVIEAVKLTGKSGEVCVKLKITPVKGDKRVVKIEDSITFNAPREPRSSIWYTDDDNNLHRNDPSQKELWSERQVADGKTAGGGRD